MMILYDLYDSGGFRGLMKKTTRRISRMAGNRNFWNIFLFF